MLGKNNCIAWSLVAGLLLVMGQGGCSRSADVPETPSPPARRETVPVAMEATGCRGCHDAVELDAGHGQLGCVACHGGRDGVGDADVAHDNLIHRPAHPDNMERVCGPCHDQVKTLPRTEHFTLANEVVMTRRAFGVVDGVADGQSVPVTPAVDSPDELVNDMLRRRCLRCHLYDNGDGYPGTRHGTGCAACHLVYRQGVVGSHRFVALPADGQCLSCHYGNRVGADYYGWFEQEYPWEYRAPFTPEGGTIRPYGLEQRQLHADLHQQAGMACVDCHYGSVLLGEGHGQPLPVKKIHCATCHRWRPGEPLPLPTLTVVEGGLQLQLRRTDKRLPVPLLRHWAHDRYRDMVSCSGCHAQWTFADGPTHLLRLDAVDFDGWDDLTVQGSFEVETQLEAVLYNQAQLELPYMTDTLSGITRQGIWLQGYGLRRWERVPLCDGDGLLRPCRPLLDLRLSYVDAEGQVVVDNLAVDPARAMVPYTPHTTGPAGLYWRRRIMQARNKTGESTHEQ